MQMGPSFTIDLARISGRGDFNCPKCGTIISPDDSKEAYELLEAVMKADCVEKLVLRCIRCGSIVELTGFVLLNEIPELPEQPHPPLFLVSVNWLIPRAVSEGDPAARATIERWQRGSSAHEVRGVQTHSACFWFCGEARTEPDIAKSLE